MSNGEAYQGTISYSEHDYKLDLRASAQSKINLVWLEKQLYRIPYGVFGSFLELDRCGHFELSLYEMAA